MSQKKEFVTRKVCITLSDLLDWFDKEILDQIFIIDFLERPIMLEIQMKYFLGIIDPMVSCLVICLIIFLVCLV